MSPLTFCEGGTAERRGEREGEGEEPKSSSSEEEEKEGRRMKGETGRRWSVGRSGQGRKEGRKWLGLICVTITLCILSLDLHFAEKLQNCMIRLVPFSI